MDYIQQDLFGGEVVEKSAISRSDLRDSLISMLRRMSLEEFSRLITNEFTETLEYGDLCQGDHACQKTSLLYNPHRLDTKSKSSRSSIYAALQTDSFCDGLARALIFKKGKVNELLYQALQLGVNGTQYINEFPPHVARGMAIKYGVDRNSKVLDPCAGWGGRMIGVSTVCDSYTAFDPSSQTYSGLLNLRDDFLGRVSPTFTADIRNSCFEDSDLTPNTYDFAITSPPYYDTEEYSNESTNSLNRYATFELWCEGFFFPMIEKVLIALKPEKTFVLNIGSRVYPLSTVLRERFGEVCTIECLGNKLSGSAGLGRDGEGESFYAIREKWSSV